MNNINLFFSKLLKSFGVHEGGFSARKLTAFVVTLLIVYTHYKWLKSCYNNNHFDLLPQVLLIDFTALLSLLGLTTWERVKSLGFGNNNNNNNNNSGSNGSSVNVDLSQNTSNTNRRRRRRPKPKQ
jgi:hypothetical protein